MPSGYGNSPARASLLKTLMLKTIFLAIALFGAVSLFAQRDTLYNIRIDTLGDLKWRSELYGDNSHIEIEQFKNNKWVSIGGSSWTCILAFDNKVKRVHNDSVRVKFHKGINRYRLVIKPSSQAYHEIELISRMANDDGSLWVSGGQIILDRKEYWEIISNTNGSILKKGETKIVDISLLPKGSYWLYTKAATKPFTRN